tara:strand:+ start:2524 stop:3447 length:924 start_codon:yes stop_codon:yes gene_type:complete
MNRLVNIAFQGGTHGNFLRFFIDKFSALTPNIQGSPFSDNNTAHKTLNYSSLINRYHPNISAPYFSHTGEPHILITVEKDDILFLERWATYRAGDYKINISEENIKIHSTFATNWKDTFLKFYNIDITTTSVPRFIMRDFYKLGFIDPDSNGYIKYDKELRKHMPHNTFCFPVSCFWNQALFIEKILELNNKFNLKISLRDMTQHTSFLHKLNIYTRDRANQVIQAIQNKADIDISNLDTAEQAFISAWLEQNYVYILTPQINNFFQSTGEILEWLQKYPQHYKAMNPNLPKFNNIDNPFYLWNQKK